MARGDEIAVLDRRYRPLRRTHFTAFVLLVFVGALVYIVAALYVVTAPEQPSLGVLCGLLCFGLTIIGLLLPVAIQRVRARRTGSHAITRNEDANALLRAGRYEEAARLWDELCAQSRHQPAIHALFCFNLGMATLHMGSPARALTFMRAAQESGWIGSPLLRHAQAQVELGMALAHAILGDVEVANAHRERAAAQLALPRQGMTMLVDAIVTAREQRWDRVRVDGPGWTAAEATLRPVQVRALRVLHAWALLETGASEEELEPWLRSVPAIRPGELDHLAVAWPELARFMETRGLAAPKA